MSTNSAALQNSLSLNSLVSVAQDQVSSELAGEIIILDLKSGVYYGLDTVGARVWSLIQESLMIAEIKEVLVEEYDVDEARCEHDLLNLIDQLHSRGLVVISSPTSQGRLSAVFDARSID